MSSHRAIVRQLPAVEMLGPISVIATDKTGFLTEGRVVVQRLWIPTAAAMWTGTGYEPDGAVSFDGRELTADAP